MDKKTAEKIIEGKIDKLDFLKKLSEVASGLKYELYIVGGFVRDAILGRTRDEIDFLVIGEGIKFAERAAKELGVKDISVFKNFGTAHFKYGEFDLEFVGARKESYKRESRKPVIENGSFIDDINRRDFTINSIAASLNKKKYCEIIDVYDGLKDIELKIIKTPLDPYITFDDDPLRIMRAFRFASQLDFSISLEVLAAAGKMAKRLEIVSQERITDEFLKILASPKPSVGIKLLFETGTLNIVFPEIANLAGVDQRQDYHHKDVFYHTCEVVDNVAKVSDNIWLRFTALVHDIAKPATKRFVEGIGWTFHGHDDLGAKMLEGIFKKLKLPLNKLDYVENLVRLHLRPIALVDEEVTDSAVRRLIVQAGESLEDLILLCRADITSKNPSKISRYLSNYEIVAKKIIEVQEKDKLRSFQSPVRGDEIMKICGLRPSKKVGIIKKAIEEAILDGKIPNDYESAKNYLLEIKDELLRESL